ncbi:redoxin domain-containing protein [Bacillus sp. S/N-304-OC-R1]|uniref:redoxin domain-containing protein n=1 Tax=Bacillus sp. S/N-304-OC-R1 TaxID=2758034 RepID=UPI001C8D93DA|nr:redoxin domain-containing protein [Bacillus sp. S/N-304-OC-R1]MBY0122834.1 redoxin domain-containing protein [Bacillus sp. S/N-304-OC-R1]
MKKNLLSFAILILAVAIIVVNLWKPYSVEGNKDLAKEKEEVTNSKSIPGSDLSQFQEGNPAPNFELTTLEGEIVRLSDYKGKKVMLNFWATWCPPCKAEMPHMQNFYENNKDKGIEILAVNLTQIDNGKEAIKTFVKAYGLTFPIPLDENAAIGTQYQAFTIPTTYIIDSNGIISKKIVGPMDEDMMVNLTRDIQ